MPFSSNQRTPGLSEAGSTKIHLKHTAADHLSLCRKWPDKNWVLSSSASAQKAGSICKLCAQVAQPPESQGSRVGFTRAEKTPIRPRRATTHEIRVGKFREWLDASAESPRDLLLKNQLRELVGG
jgi:hypothetical protein